MVSAQPTVSFQKKILAFLLILILWGFIYLPTFGFQILDYDDILTISENPAVRNLKDIETIWKSFNTRFIPGLTFALNYAFHGLNAQGYHVVNALIHLGSAWLVFVLVGGLCGTPVLRNIYSPSTVFRIALATALIFVAHPLQTEAVTFVTQRYAILAGFFYLCTLNLYLKGRLQSQRKYLIGAWMTAVLAMFSKEYTFTLPIMLTVLEIYFWSPFLREWRKRLRILWPFLLMLCIIPLTLSNTSLEAVGSTRIAQIALGDSSSVHVDISRAASPFTRHDYFLTELNVLVTYLRLFLFPINQNLDYDYPLSKGIFDGTTFLSALFLGGLLILVIRLFSSQRLLSFAILWFFLTLSVESSLIPIGHVIAEYRMYLAIMGVALFVSVLLAQLLRNSLRYSVALTMILIILSTLAVSRNWLWSDPILLWEDTARKSPHKARPHINLGKWYAEQTKYEQAKEHFEQAIQIDPKDPKTYNNLGVVYLREGDVGRAIEFYQKAVGVDPHYALAYFNLGMAHSYRGELAEEVECYQKALELNPQDEGAIFALGEAYGDLKDDQAWEQISRLEKLGRHDLAGELQGVLRKKFHQE
ncbi:MAG: tetratricopeptide repeat protein [Candidatus Omnitrophica bacterium]|nr:tetratricopeptide repeat protein [Candidatus Omnitrophota bacterium]